MASDISLTADHGPRPALWRDRKRYLWLLGLILPTMLFAMLPAVWGLNRAGWHTSAQLPLWIGPILIYLMLPTLDLLVGTDGHNPPADAVGVRRVDIAGLITAAVEAVGLVAPRLRLSVGDDVARSRSMLRGCGVC